MRSVRQGRLFTDTFDKLREFLIGEHSARDNTARRIGRLYREQTLCRYDNSQKVRALSIKPLSFSDSRTRRLEFRDTTRSRKSTLGATCSRP